MNYKESVTILVVASFILANAASAKFDFLQETNPILKGFMARANDHTECFSYYIPLIDDIAQTYQKKRDACIQNSLDGRAQAEAATLQKRNNLASNVNSTCEYMSRCSEFVGAEDVFECYKRKGSENTKIAYDINVNASQHLDDLQEEFRVIDHKSYKCTNDSKRVYERDSTQAYADFNQCLLGNIDVPTTTKAPVPTTTTEKPATAVNAEVTEATTEKYEDPAIPEDPIAPESRSAAKIPIRSSKFSFNKNNKWN